MKSYLSGNPELKLALNEDIVIGKGQSSGYGAVVLDDCNFHECVDLSDFDDQSIQFMIFEALHLAIFSAANFFRLPVRDGLGILC